MCIYGPQNVIHLVSTFEEALYVSRGFLLPKLVGKCPRAREWFMLHFRYVNVDERWCLVGEYLKGFGIGGGG